MNSVRHPLTAVERILISPDDNSALVPIARDELDIGYISGAGFFHPIVDGIPVILPVHLRNARLEEEAVKLAGVDNVEGIQGWKEIIRNTLEAISNAQPDEEWEWEDEVFWSREYSSQINGDSAKNWNDRLWRNEKLVLQAVNLSNGFQQETILDIGAGDGHYFRRIIARPSIDDAMYVACDISIEALKLNRRLNPHHNATYIVCSADNLPFRPSSVGAAFLFGILHHSRHQADSLAGVVSVVKDGGLVILHEGVKRTTLSDVFPFISNRDLESTHEHRLVRRNLADALQHKDIQVLDYEEYSTMFYGASMRLIGRFIVRWRKLFTVVSLIDRVIAKTVGRFTSILAGGEVLALLRINRSK